MTLADRMPPIAFADMTAEQRAAVVDFKQTRNTSSFEGPFIPLLRSPELLGRVQVVGQYLRYRSALPRRLSELAILVTARHWGQQFEWHVHSADAAAVGLSSTIIEAIAEGRRPPDMDRGRSGPVRLLPGAAAQSERQRPDLRPRGGAVWRAGRHRHRRTPGVLLAAGDGAEHRADADS